MKVLEILDPKEWETNAIDPKTHLKQLKKKQLSLQHHRAIIVQNIVQKNLNYREDSFVYWDLERRSIEDFPESIRHYVAQLKKIDTKIEELSKKAVRAKINMKYAIHDPDLALRHALGVRKGPYPEGEDAIASTAKTAYAYAVDILHGRFPKGEAAIGKDPDLNFQYHSFLRRLKQGLISPDWDLAK